MVAVRSQLGPIDDSVQSTEGAAGQQHEQGCEAAVVSVLLPVVRAAQLEVLSVPLLRSRLRCDMAAMKHPARPPTTRLRMIRLSARKLVDNVITPTPTT